MKLPERHEKKNTLENMEEYTSCYTVPRAMRVDQQGQCHLNESFSWEERPGGTVQLKITKVPEGYIVHIDDMEDDYKREKKNEQWIMSDFEKCYGRVVASSIDEYCKKYSISPQRFPSTIEKVDEIKHKKTLRDLIRNLKNGISWN